CTYIWIKVKVSDFPDVFDQRFGVRCEGLCEMLADTIVEAQVNKQLNYSEVNSDTVARPASYISYAYPDCTCQQCLGETTQIILRPSTSVVQWYIGPKPMT